MAPIPSSPGLPRLVMYYQTHHSQSGQPISVLPLITQPNIHLTHLILAAIHINSSPDALTLNDHPPSHPRFQTLWAELRVLQASGVKVMGMLGGAAKGSYERLDGSDEQFEQYYTPVRNLIRERGLDGLDLDVEEEMSLNGVIRLIDRLRSDFGRDFIVTLAPVAAAMIDFTKNLSGFDYETLEVMRGRDISWYNTQFYCGWGDCSNTLMFDYMVRKGWPPEKLVIGLVTNPANGAGYVPFDALSTVFAGLRANYGEFGGVMGWEYFNGLPSGTERPWEWAKEMTKLLRGQIIGTTRKVRSTDIDEDRPGVQDAEVPRPFEYYSDGGDE